MGITYPRQGNPSVSVTGGGTDTGLTAAAYGTAAEWTAANPVLAKGELGYETDTYVHKVGDGSTAWSSLSSSGSGTYLQKSSNLSDLTSASTARSSLGLGASAVMSTAQIAADSALTGTYVPNAITGTWVASTSYAVGTKLAYAGRYWVRTGTPSAAETTFDYTKWAYSGRVAGGWGSSIVLIGNSRILLEWINGNSTQQRGIFAWANTLMGERFTVLKRAGVSGDTLTQMAARWATDVGAYVPENVLILDGLNDISAGATLAQVQARYQTLIDLNRAIGARTILPTVLPNDGHGAGPKAVWAAVNHWIGTITDPDVVTVDLTSAIASTTTSDTWASGYATDGIHQNRNGAARLGRIVANALSPLVPPSTILPTSYTEATVNPLLNPLMDSAGAVSGVPTGWTVFPSAGGAVTYSLVARTDRVSGNWFQADTATTTTQTFLAQTVAISGFAVIGDTVEAVWEMQGDAITVAATNGLKVYLQALTAGNAVVVANEALGYYSAAQVGDSGDASGYPVADLPGVSSNAVFRTPPMVIPATTTQLKLLVEYRAQGKLRMGRAAIYKL